MTDNVQTTEKIVLDQKLHVEANFQLADKLVGAHGFRLEEPKVSAHDFLSRYFSSRRHRRSSDASESGPSQRCILTNVECHEDTEEYVMTDEEAWLSPPRARGFTLASKQWALFLVDHIQEINYREESFSMLEIDPLIKETIRALVEMHRHTTRQFDDVIQEKGKGIIMSLEGPAGSGKTLTAGEFDLEELPRLRIAKSGVFFNTNTDARIDRRTDSSATLCHQYR